MDLIRSKRIFIAFLRILLLFALLAGLGVSKTLGQCMGQPTDEKYKTYSGPCGIRDWELVVY